MNQLKPACVLVALLALFPTLSAAQTGALFGRVRLRQADGQTVPVAGATIDVFRLDLAGQYNTKTDSKGEFVFAGLPFIGEYLVAASAPRVKPGVIPNVKAGRDVHYELVVAAGDGARLTREEAEAAITEAPNPGSIDEILSRIFQKGNEAIRKGDYDEARKLFDEGLAIRPNEPALWLNKSTALRSRGVGKYNHAIITHDETEKSVFIKSASGDFRDAADAATRAVEIIKGQLIPADEKDRQFQQRIKLSGFKARSEAMRLLVLVDPGQVAIGLAAFQEYIDVEDDPALKTRAALEAAHMLLGAKATDSAIDSFQRILVSDPKSLEARVGYGLALYQSGDRKRFAEAARYLRSFLDEAPAGDSLRQVATETLEKLKANP